MSALRSFFQVYVPSLSISLSVLAVGNRALAKEYWVAPPPLGNDTAAGTQAAPFASVSRAQTAAIAGDTVYIRGGTYAFNGSGTVGVAFNKSGSPNNPIKYFAAPGEVPVFDLTQLTPSNRVTGLDVHCNYVHLRGLEVKGVRQYMSGQDSWGVRVQGSNNVLENLNVHHNEAPGIFITSGSNNLVVNCDSHHNYDKAESGGSGDGFGCHSSGGGNVLRGCRAYDNSDDGFDFINAAGSCAVERSFAFRNGWVPDTRTAAGNGAGFKAGGYGSPPSVPAGGAATHSVAQCVAFDNRSQGFYANHHPGRINFYNNTAFGNPVNYNMLADAGYPSSHQLRNNVAMASGTPLSNLSGGSAVSNSWDLNVMVSAADFVSTAQADALSPRQQDGSLPENGFMRLSVNSDLLDKGVEVGLPFSGSAPDLGAFERGAVMGEAGGGAAGGGAAGGTQSRGGTSSGGAASGGTASGGWNSGGRNAAGAPSFGGGPSFGGASSGGTSNGGAPHLGGAAMSTGGAPSAASGSPSSGGGAAPSGAAGTAASNNADGGALSAGGQVTSGGGMPQAAAGLGGGNLNGSPQGAGAATTGGNSSVDAAPTMSEAPQPSGCTCQVPRPGGASGTASGALFALFVAASVRRKRARHTLARTRL